MSKTFSLGADPEMFLVDAANSLVSAIGRIGGSKEMPLPLVEIGDGFAVQEDNVAVEYNIPPSHSRIAFENNITMAMECLTTRVRDMGLKFINLSAAQFPKEQLSDPRAMVFGCDPDFNAWKDGRKNPRPRATDATLRTCGGHVHVGYRFESPEDVISFIKHMDLFTIGSVLMDKGELRKELYGKAGAFRFKPYGCEYRSLSNFWIFDKKLTNWVWDCASMAMYAWQNKKIDIDAEAKMILSAINKNNKEAASILIDKHNLLVV